MPSIDQEPLDQVLKQYNIKVLSIRNESYKDKKGVWWIQTPEGYKILKKISNSEDTLRFILSAIRHLSGNGILIPRVVKTKSGEDYAAIDTVCYVLSDAVEGKNPSYNVEEQLARVAKELAGFHKASAGFSPPSGSKPKIHLGTWIEEYSNQIEDMNRFYSRESSLKNNTETGRIILKEFPYFYKRAQEAIKSLKGPEYAAWVEKVRKTGSLCHQDFAAGNLFITPSGKICVIDTDSITIDIPARDIRKLLNKVMKKKGGWDINMAKRILSYYQSVNPLTRDEWQVVKLDLMYPHLFIGAMNKYYYKRDKEWSEANYLKRIKEMSSFEKTIENILDNFDTIMPL